MRAAADSTALIHDRLRQREPDLRALGVRRLRLFGSFARGEQGPESDVDLLLEFEPGRKSFDSFLAIGSLLEELLQRRVELLTPESLSPYLAPRILSEVEDVLPWHCLTIIGEATKKLPAEVTEPHPEISGGRWPGCATA